MKKIFVLWALTLLFARAVPASRINNPDGSVSIGIKLGGSSAESTAAVAALAVYFGYQPTLSNGTANPETRAQFVDRALREQVRAWIKEGRAAAAARTARETEDQKPLPEVQ